ncbi:MAG: site-specific DNA-methyltransferase [Candidatus Acidiferrales bacterium]|jgi:site-specific DNA-methyltransferase (cytosine-N4-specific)
MNTALSIVPIKLAYFDAARAAIEKAASIDEIRRIRDKAEALRIYHKQSKDGLAMQNRCAEIKIRAERRAGEILDEMKETGRRETGKGDHRPKFHDGTSIPKLEDLGISKKQSFRWQAIASIPKLVFEKHISEITSTNVEELTTVGLVNESYRYRKIKPERKFIGTPSEGYVLIRADAGQIPLAAKSVQVIVTSPPYFGLRVYQGSTDAPFGQESSVIEYIVRTIAILQECRRVLRDDGVLFYTIGDTYASDTKVTGGIRSFETNKRGSCTPNGKKFKSGIPTGNLCLIPERVAVAAQEDGWIVRSVIIFEKENPMPESVKNRPTRSYEKILMLTKSGRYFWDAEAASEPSSGKTATFSKPGKTHGIICRNDIKYDRTMGKCPSEYFSPKRNIRNVWTFALQPFTGAHWGTFPEELPTRCIQAASRIGDIVLDPFCGSGTTGVAALRLQRKFVGIDLAYHGLARNRIEESLKQGGGMDP